MQDFTGVPAVVDLVAMRDAIAELGGDPSKINPLIPAELVIDHSVIADVFGRPDAFRVNAGLEFDRNKERYLLLRWAQQAFDNLQRRAPGHRHLPSGQPGVPSPGGVHPRQRTAGLPGHAYRHRLPHADGQRARRARLGCRRYRGRGRDARPADEHADTAGHRSQADQRTAARHNRNRPGADRCRTAAQVPASSASSSSSTAPAWRTFRWRTGQRSAT